MGLLGLKLGLKLRLDPQALKIEKWQVGKCWREGGKVNDLKKRKREKKKKGLYARFTLVAS